MSKKVNSPNNFESDFFKSQKFKDSIRKTIEQNTWDKGLPMVYINKDGWIVKHWKSGLIEKIKKVEK